MTTVQRRYGYDAMEKVEGVCRTSLGCPLAGSRCFVPSAQPVSGSDFPSYVRVHFIRTACLWPLRKAAHRASTSPQPFYLQCQQSHLLSLSLWDSFDASLCDFPLTLSQTGNLMRILFSAIGRGGLRAPFYPAISYLNKGFVL